MTVRKILVLGGYGNFGKRIVESLSKIDHLTLFIAGRNIDKARLTQTALIANKASSTILEVARLDITSSSFVDDLKIISPDLIIHTGGPFQNQSYIVPRACIAVGSHYIDLADDRRYVCDITQLNDEAVKNNLLLVSGASSVPGLSSTVIDYFLDRFSILRKIDFAIAPGNKAERGEATVKGILSYTGRPFPVFSNNQWVNEYGWMSPRKLDFGKVIGKRWLASIDIPDLELFPQRYAPVSHVRFQAGLELPFLHFGMVLMAFIARIRLVKNWSPFTSVIFKSSEIFKSFGTDTGGMRIMLSGLDKDNVKQNISWTLCAENGVGPHIPTLSAIIIAKKLIAGNMKDLGATPCLGLFTLDEFDQEAGSLGIYHKTDVFNG